MTEMPLSLSWWERLDRNEILAAVESLSAGCLVLEGDGAAGKSQAASLVEHALQASGYETLRVQSASGVAWTSTAAIQAAWNELQQRHQLYRRALPAEAIMAGGLPIAKSCRIVAKLLETIEPPYALLLEDVDREDETSVNFRPLVGSIALRAQRPIIITYDPASAVWPAHEGTQVVRLRDFDVSDVVACVSRTSELGPLDEADVEGVLRNVFGSTAPLGPVRPLTAYVALRAWGGARS